MHINHTFMSLGRNICLGYYTNPVVAEPYSMMTSSNGNILRVTGPLSGEFPAQRPVTRSFDVFFDLRLNKRLSKQSWGWWFETPSRPLWRYCTCLPRRLVSTCTISASRIYRKYKYILVFPYVKGEAKGYNKDYIYCIHSGYSVVKIAAPDGLRRCWELEIMCKVKSIQVVQMNINGLQHGTI